MTSQLASQLQRLQQRPVGDKRLSQSFLFDSNQSRDFSREQVHQLAVHGLQTLVAIDNRFHPFFEGLFHPHKTRVERKLLSTEENENINAMLEQFLTLLSPHMFLTAAHQVFEYLVRVHEVHVYNVVAVLRAFLPYHDHSLFARALLLLDLRDTGFAFLEKNQDHGAPLLREHLVLACAESRKVLRLVCLALAMSVRLKVQNRAANALFTGVAVRLASHPDSEALWRVLLPFILEFIGAETMSGVNGEGGAQFFDDVHGGPAQQPSCEVACGALLVLSAWSCEVQMSVSTLAAVTKPIIRLLTEAGDKVAAYSSSFGVVPTADLLGVIDLLFFSQRAVVTQVTFGPQIQLLLALPWKRWTPWIAAAGAGMYESVITVLLRYCVQRLRVAHSIESVAQDVLSFVQCVVDDFSLTDELVAEVIQALVGCHVKKLQDAHPKEDVTENEEEPKEKNETKTGSYDDVASKGAFFLSGWIRALERRFLHVFDMTLSRLLNDVATQAAATAFLARHFSGTRYELLDVRGSFGGAECLPIFSCLLHPIAEVRMLAAKAMENMTAVQLTTSSSARGSGAAGNSLLELLVHVVQYEQSHHIAHQFLRTSAAAAVKLLAFLDDKEATDGTVLTDQRVIVFYVRDILSSLWVMVTQHDISLQMSFFSALLRPLLQRFGSRISRSLVKKKANKKGKKELDSGSTEAVAFQDTFRGLALYYLTLQYMYAVSQQAEGEYTTGGVIETNVSDPEAQLEEFIFELEQELTTAIPGICKAAACLTVTKGLKVPHTCEAEAMDDDDKDHHGKGKRGDNCVRASNSFFFARGNTRDYLSLFESAQLMQLLHEEASARLQSALAQLRGTVGEESFLRKTKVAMFECCLTCASCLATSETVNADGITKTLLQFFIAGGDTATHTNESSVAGYLGMLRETQRAALGKDNGKVGRGAKSTLETLCLPRNEITDAVGETLRCSMGLRLRNEGTTRAELAVLVRIARLLGLLSTPLPPLAQSPTTFAEVYLRLLDQTSDSFGEKQFSVDWFGLVYTSVFRARCSAGDAVSAAAGGRRCSLQTLFLTFFCLLAAPTGQREALLQELQGIVLAATREPRDNSGVVKKSNKSTGLVESTTGARMAVEFALHEERISATTLSAIIEFVALGESRGNLTHSAAELLCRMMASGKVNDLSENEPAVPFSISCCAMDFFFPLPKKSSRGESATCGIVMGNVLPLLKSILTIGGSCCNASNAVVAGAVSLSAADFLDAVCRRVKLGAVSDYDEDVFLQLCLELIQYPFLRVIGGRVRPVYRHALTALATLLSYGIKEKRGNSVLFIPNNNNNKKATLLSSSELSCGAKEKKGVHIGEEYLSSVASAVSQALLGEAGQLNRIGRDANMFLAGTLGGYHRIFLPWVAQLLRQSAPDLSVVVEVVEGLAAAPAPPTTEVADVWEPPSWCTLHCPLTFSDARDLLRLCEKARDFGTRNASTINVLRLLCSIISLSPSISFEADSDSDSADDDGGFSSSLFTLIDTLLDLFPLSSLSSLFLEAADDKNKESSDCNDYYGVYNDGKYNTTCQLPFVRWALAYVSALVDLCVSSPQSLNEGKSDGAARISRTVVKQSVILMAALLVHDSAPVVGVDAENEEEGGEEQGEQTGGKMKTTAALSRERINLIAELLRIVSSLFTTVSAALSTCSTDELHTATGGRSALHIPVVALLIRLESVDLTAYDGYESAVDVCSNLITSFDVHTQLTCLAQMMGLLIDPHKQLSIPAGVLQKDEVEEKEEKRRNRTNDDYAVIKLFRKLLKPNQVINRQEMILNLINSTVKSEAFLAGFLNLQHHQHASRALHVTQGDDKRNHFTENGERTSDECMALLVASLELFAHYAELNAALANDAVATVNRKQDINAYEEQLEYGENKAFMMLLELLSGNTLACVLAGINETTFVACLGRLLTDQRVVVQQKGLEVLLDRLHHALPTVENTLSDEEMKKHRQQLRDPKHKLTLMDFIRIKARPLTTKRSFALFQHLSAIIHACGKTAATRLSGGEMNHLHMLSLAVGCMEELVRIISSGGSLQAEKTLLNVHRANRVTEATLSKLFGTKARVQEVHRFVDDIVVMISSFLWQDFTGDKKATSSPLSLAAEGDVLLAVAALLTALGTISQVMGAAFITSHSNAILRAVVGAAVFSVAHVVPVVSRSEVGSVLRQASLGCLLRVFPLCWLMCHPYLSRIIFAATHLHNVDDTETNYRSKEVMGMLEAVLEPQLFVEACAECLHGVPACNAGGARKLLRVRVDTHSFLLLYTSVQRRVGSLKREELRSLSVLVDGTTAKENFWLASLHALASAPALPSHDIINPVLEAYTTFFLKFKAKHCALYLSAIAEWAFGGVSEDFLKRMEKQQQQQLQQYDIVGSGDCERDDAWLAPRSTLHSWLLFYTLSNYLLERLGSIMDFGFPVIMPYVIGTLTGYCSSAKHTARHLGGLIALTLEGALDTVRRIALSQTAGPDHDHSVPVDNYLETPEVFNSVMPATVRQVTNLAYLADGTRDYLFRAEHHVIPAVRALFQSLTSSKLQSRTQNELLKALRHPSRHVRRIALLCLDGIYADGGDELASRLMAEMLPAVVEMTEDCDDDVVEQARKLCNNLSSITGQDVLYSMAL